MAFPSRPTAGELSNIQSDEQDGSLPLSGQCAVLFLQPHFLYNFFQRFRD